MLCSHWDKLNVCFFCGNEYVYPQKCSYKSGKGIRTLKYALSEVKEKEKNQ